MSPFICLPLSLSLDAWHGSLGGRVHLSPFVSLHLSPSLDAWRGLGSFVSLWTGTDSLVSLCLPSFVARSLPAWMPVTALWVDGFICLPLSPLISPVVSQPGCLARLSGGSFVSLCRPSFVSRCLPAWMPGAALWVDGFICLPLSLRCLAPLCFPSFVSRLPAWMPGTVFLVDRFTFLPLSPFIWLLFSPSLDVSHGSPGGRIPSFVSHLWLWTDSFVSLCLPLFVSRCLPAWMPGTALWVDGFICLPLSPSLDVWHSRIAVSFTCPFGGVWFAFGFGPGFGHSLSCGCWGQGPPLFALHLDFDFAWARGGSSSLSIVGYTLSVRSVPRYQLQSRADDSGALRCAASATRRLC